jgi:flagellar hook-associated protein 2
MGLSSPGIGSNLDVNGIVSKLMSVEQQPLIMLQTKETSYQAKLSGFGTLKGAVSSFQTAVAGLADISKFQGVRASAADPSVATLSGTSAAAPGNYALTVTQLAQAQKLVAAGTASQTTPVGSGVISIDFGTIAGGTVTNGTYSGASFTSGGGGVKTITIDSSNNSLTGIRDAINAAGAGVTASIVNDGSGTPYRLSLTSSQTGAASSMKISVANTAPDTGLSALLNNDPAGSQALTQISAAQDAQLTIDGIAITKPSNTISDTLTGVTLNLLKTNAGAPTTLTVSRDTSSVTTAVNGFVKAFNDISQTLRDASAYNATTKTAAILNGESTVRTMQTQVASILSAPVAGGASVYSRLSDIGVSLQKDGTLSVDSTKLNAALANNFDGFAGLFAATGKATDSLVTYSGASDKTVPGSYDINVTRLATQGSTQATAPAGLTIDGTNNTLSVTLNGELASVTLSQKAYASAADLAAEIQSKINGNPAFVTAGSTVQVTQTGGVLKITSGLYGSLSGINIAETGTPNLKFDTSGANVQSGVDVAGTINGATATGSGQLLTGATGDASAGLGVLIAGGLGARGKINYSQGYAYQFNQMATAMLSSTGAMAARTDGLNASIKLLTQDQADMNVKLAATEARYRAQFTALDVAISSMNTTASFLTQQLAQISGLTVSSK